MENQNLSILLQWKIKTWTTYAPAMCNVIWIVTQTLGLTPCTRIHDNGWIWALYQNTHCCLSWIGFICLRCMSSSFKIVSKPMIFFHVSLSIFVSKVEFPILFYYKSPTNLPFWRHQFTTLWLNISGTSDIKGI